jgi:hypothetical protein
MLGLGWVGCIARVLGLGHWSKNWFLIFSMKRGTLLARINLFACLCG